MAHFAADMLPWILFGNCEDDPSTTAERIEAYVRDHKDAFQRLVDSRKGVYLPQNFDLQGVGQSATFSLFSRALRLAQFDLDAFVPERAHEAEMQQQYFAALELGLKRALIRPSER